MRVKRGNVARQKRKKILNLTKGSRGSISKLTRPAKQAVVHAMRNMYEHRKLKKRDYRSLWITRINATLDAQGLSYSKFCGLLKKTNILLNRKMLADLAVNNPDTFKAIVACATK